MGLMHDDKERSASARITAVPLQCFAEIRMQIHGLPIVSRLYRHLFLSPPIFPIFGLLSGTLGWMSLLAGRAGPSHGIPTYVSFDVLVFIALGAMLFILVPPLFSASIYRMKTWFCLMISCIVYCISFLVLLGQQSGKEPSLAFCTFGAGLIYSAPTGIAAAALGFVIELCLRLYSTLSTNRESLNNKLSKRVIYLILISPVAHSIVFWVSVFTGLSNPFTIKRHSSGAYCRIDHALPTLLNGITVILFVLIMVGFEFYIVYVLLKKRSDARAIRVSGAYFPISLFVRTACFTFIAGCTVIVTIIINTNPGETTNDALYTVAAVPLSVGLLFGTQTDILKTYFCFWRRKRNPYFDRVIKGDNA